MEPLKGISSTSASRQLAVPGYNPILGRARDGTSTAGISAAQRNGQYDFFTRSHFRNSARRTVLPPASVTQLRSVRIPNRVRPMPGAPDLRIAQEIGARASLPGGMSGRARRGIASDLRAIFKKHRVVGSERAD